MKAIAVTPVTKAVRLVDRPEPKLVFPSDVKMRTLRGGIHNFNEHTSFPAERDDLFRCRFGMRREHPLECARPIDLSRGQETMFVTVHWAD